MIYFLRNLNQKKKKPKLNKTKTYSFREKKYVVARWEGMGE